MNDAAGNEVFAVIRRMRKLYDECGPEPGQSDRFFAKLHGPDWKERALADAPPQENLVYASRLRDLQARVERIESHLKLKGSE